MKTEQKAFTVIGISTTTDNTSEMSSEASNIPQLWNQFFKEEVSAQIAHKLSEEIYAVYHSFTGDSSGEYTLTIGYKARPNGDLPEGFDVVNVEAGNYKKLTTEKGKMPDVVVDLWNRIWKEDTQLLGGARKYLTDYEVYDQRAMMPDGAQMEIYIGLQS